MPKRKMSLTELDNVGITMAIISVFVNKSGSGRFVRPACCLILASILQTYRSHGATLGGSLRRNKRVKANVTYVDPLHCGTPGLGRAGISSSDQKYERRDQLICENGKADRSI